MKKIIALLTLSSLIMAACNRSAEVNKKDPLEAGRGFIDASLKGDYVEAKKYLLDDSTNIEYFEGFSDFSKKASREERDGLRDANIIIDSVRQASDSVYLINYKNSFKKVPSKLKLVKKGDQWLVDFKYTFNENL